MTAYCLFDNLKITNPEALAEYARRALPTVRAYGGEYVVVRGAFHSHEGSWVPTDPVMIKFPSIEAADAWYESADYAPLKALRQSAGTFNVVFIEGIG